MTLTAEAMKIKELSERSGLPFLECRKALTQAKWDIEQAMILLRAWHPVKYKMDG